VELPGDSKFEEMTRTLVRDGVPVKGRGGAVPIDILVLLMGRADAEPLSVSSAVDWDTLVVLRLSRSL
jgi:hypothetical protein